MRAIESESKRTPDLTRGKRADHCRESDDALNYKVQATNLRGQLRKLNVELALNVLRVGSPLLLLGSGLGLILMRRYKLGSLVLMGLLAGRKLGIKMDEPSRDPKEIELERYALKLEMGDYGKMEVIAFR